MAQTLVDLRGKVVCITGALSWADRGDAIARIERVSGRFDKRAHYADVLVVGDTRQHGVTKKMKTARPGAITITGDDLLASCLYTLSLMIGLTTIKAREPRAVVDQDKLNKLLDDAEEAFKSW